MKPVVMFNPYTGTPRHPSDIASDPQGLLIWDGETPLKAYTRPAPLTVDQVFSSEPIMALNGEALGLDMDTLMKVVRAIERAIFEGE